MGCRKNTDNKKANSPCEPKNKQELKRDVFLACQRASDGKYESCIL